MFYPVLDLLGVGAQKLVPTFPNPRNSAVVIDVFLLQNKPEVTHCLVQLQLQHQRVVYSKLFLTDKSTITNKAGSLY